MSRILSVTLLSALCTLACRGWESEDPPVHLIPNMDTQEKGRPYRHDTGDRATGVLPDQRWMQPPPEGTVAQGEFVEDDDFVEGKTADGTPIGKYPASMPYSEELAARGIQRLHIYCSPCHGMEGDGDGTVAKRGGLLVPPPSFHDPRLKSMAIGQIYSAIKNGVNNNNMPSYAAQIPVQDRWAIVMGVRKLQMGRDPTVDPEKGAGAVAAVDMSKGPSAKGGEYLYSLGCNACHTTDGTAKVGPTWKGLYGKTEQTSAGAVTVDDAYITESIRNPTAKIVNGFPPAMPPYPQLSDIEVQSLILYIKSLK